MKNAVLFVEKVRLWLFVRIQNINNDKVNFFMNSYWLHSPSVVLYEGEGGKTLPLFFFPKRKKKKHPFSLLGGGGWRKRLFLFSLLPYDSNPFFMIYLSLLFLKKDFSPFFSWKSKRLSIRSPLFLLSLPFYSLISFSFY